MSLWAGVACASSRNVSPAILTMLFKYMNSSKSSAIAWWILPAPELIKPLTARIRLSFSLLYFKPLQLLQETCGAPSKTSIAPPENALLYLSGTSEGVAVYECGSDSKPELTPISVDGNFINPEGWEGNVFRNKDGFIQFDLGLFQNQTEEFVNSTVVLNDKNVVTQPIPGSIPYARWAVLSNDGEGPPLGLVDMAYVTRIDSVGGAPGTKKCKPGSEVKQPYKATYNMYTCEEGFLTPVPAAAPIAEVPTPAPAAAPAEAPAAAPAAAPIAPNLPIVPIELPTVLPPEPEIIEVIEVIEVPVPAPAAAPVPEVIPVAVATTPAPAPPAPVSGAVAPVKLVAAMSLFLSAAFMLA